MKNNKFERIIRLSIFIFVNIFILLIIAGLIYTIIFVEFPEVVFFPGAHLPIRRSFLNSALVLAILSTIIVNVLIYKSPFKYINTVGKIFAYIFFLLPVLYLFVYLLIQTEVHIGVDDPTYFISYFGIFTIDIMVFDGLEMIFILILYMHSMAIVFASHISDANEKMNSSNLISKS